MAVVEVIGRSSDDDSPFTFDSVTLHPLRPPVEYVPWVVDELEPNVFLATHLPAKFEIHDLKTYLQKPFLALDATSCTRAVTEVQIVENQRALLFLSPSASDEASDEGKVKKLTML